MASKILVVLLFFTCSIFSIKAIAQEFSLIKGKVLQSDTDEPVPFAHVYWSGFEKQGVVSDILGGFELKKLSGIDTLVISHVSFQKKKIHINDVNQSQRFYLQAKQVELKEMVFLAGENPAFPILRKAIANKKNNDPNNLRSYRYESYDKMVFTVDGVSEDGVRRTKFDTLFDGAHLLVSESLSEVVYKRPAKRHETVKASQISGFENLMTALVSSTIQPFSFYEDYITVVEIPYLNPLSRDGFKKYDYFLEDSVQSNGATSYIISFQPQEGKTYLLGSGLMTISTHQYGLENIIFKSLDNRSNLEFELQQKSKWDGDYWFPEQINSIYLFKNFDIEGSPMKLISQNFISNVNVNEAIPTKELPRVGLIYDIQNDRFPITLVRRDSLSIAEKGAYKRFEEMDGKMLLRSQRAINVLTQLFTGRVSLGSVDLLTDRIVRINQYEGLALGLGLATNQRLSKFMELDGYFRYGLRDKGWKYGLGMTTYLQDIRESKIRFFYSQDIAEIGMHPFMRARTFSSSSDVFRFFLAEKMDAVERFAVEFSQLATQRLRVSLTASTEYRDPLWVTMADLPELRNVFQSFRATELGLNLRYIAKESTSKIGRQILPGPISYPVVHMHVSRAIPQVMNGTADFWKIAAKTQHQWRTGVSTHQLTIEGMGLWGNVVPISYFNTGFGVQPQERSFSISLPGYFQTMRIYEFFSDRVIYANYSYLTGPLYEQRLNSMLIAPQLNLVQGFAIGTVNHAFGEEQFPFQTMEKGYLESGLELQNLLKYKSGFGFQGIGIGAYYRWGAYANPTFRENLFVNLSLKVAF